MPEDRLVFLAMHSPLETYVADAPGVTTKDRRELFKLLTGRPNLYAVAGHTHTTEHRYFGKDDGFKGPGEFHHHVLSTVSGSWWSGPFDPRGIPTTDQRDGTPNGYHLLEVQGTDLSVRYKAAGYSANYQMRIVFDVVHHGLRADGMRDFRAGELFDSRFSEDQVPAAEILVNLFEVAFFFIDREARFGDELSHLVGGVAMNPAAHFAALLDTVFHCEFEFLETFGMEHVVELGP